MNRIFFHKVYSAMLIIALAFGQVGAGFFHNKHDAHETIVDLDHTVLVAHGEHCKICSVDWVHQFLSGDLSIEVSTVASNTFFEVNYNSLITSPRLLTKDRAPPTIA